MPQARGMTKDFEETTRSFCGWSRIGRALHGEWPTAARLCLFAVGSAMLVILVVSTLAWCDKRSKAKPAKPPPKATNETKKSK